MSSPTMPVQPVQKRVRNFSEVTLSFSKKQALDEAMRCPQPTNPEHIHKCPLGIDVHGFIRLIREGDINGALLKIREHNSLAAVCGRICTAPCENDVFEGEKWPIAIRTLERFVVEYGDKRNFKKGKTPHKGQKVAVVGSGPGGLAAAAQLAKLDYQVTIFEALHAAGGVLRYGIPELRLPRKVLDEEIDYVKSLGVVIQTDNLIGQTFNLNELLQAEYKAVLLSVGTGAPQSLGIPGENLRGVLLASEFLMRVNLMHGHFYPNYATSLPIGKKILVIGGNNDALDAARLCVRLGKEVTLVYDKTEDEIAVKRQDIEYTKEEGVKFEMFTKPVQILADEHNSVKGVKCIHLDFADPTSSGRWKLAEVHDSEFILAADTVIVSAGYKPNALLGKLDPNLKMKKDGSFFTKVNSCMSSLPGVFAAQSATSVVEAMTLAKQAVLEIDKYLFKK